MNESRSIRVIIADDQELVRAGFAMVIGSQPDMEVVGQASDGAQAVALAESLHPDVVLMDVRMPGMDGIEATSRITSLSDAPGDATVSAESADDRPTRVIILTTFDLDEYVMAAINAGASGFLLKDTEPETLLNSIRTVFQGNAIIAPSATKRLIEKMMQDGYAQHGSLTGDVARSGAVYGSAVGVSGGAAGNGAGSMTGIPSPAGAASDGSNTSRPAYTDPELDLLTDREREVLVEIAHGLSNQEIADKLFISLPTVKTHVAHILAKINARDRVQAVVFAYDNGLV
ncbi:response regulator transcription factor [Bifidobacterium longum]|nr:response regulator transcription factor [Bifidobacterium longum]